MSKIDECRARLLGQARFGTEFSHHAALVEFEDAVRAEAEERVWKLIEKVLGAREDLTLGPSVDGGDWAVHKEEFFVTGRASTAREAILAAAKELGIEEEECVK